MNLYAHKTLDPSGGRTHLFAVTAPNEAFKNYKAQYQKLRGDHLKTEILEDLRSQIEGAHSLAELNNLKDNLMQSPEYNILKKGQGVFTKITGIKTSSVKALEAMFKEKEAIIKEELGRGSKPST